MKDSLEFKLAKLLVAAAWADGDVKIDEVNVLKDLIFNLPGISGEDWLLLELYMDAPINDEETEHLLKDVMQAIKSPADKLMVSNTLHALVESDGKASSEEEAFIRKVEKALAGKRTNPIAILGGFLKNSISFKSRDVPKRERLFHDFVRNSVYYQLHHENKHKEFKISDRELRKLCLKAGLLARVCNQDGTPEIKEAQTIGQVLQELGKITQKEALILVEAGFYRTARGLDFSHLCRSYFEVTEHEERCEFLKLLFKAAAASGGSCHDEIQTIRDISVHLKISHTRYIEAKLSVFSN